MAYIKDNAKGEKREGRRGRATSFNFSEAGIYQNIEEFLTTKAHQGAEGRYKALPHTSFVRLIRLCG
jgi:hypothetical protein